MRRLPGSEIGAPASNGNPELCESRWRKVAPGGPAGSSRSMSPSSAATSIASADASLVTDAHSKRRLSSPRVASTAPVTQTATCSHGHPSTWRSASTMGQTRRMERQHISSGAAFEERVGYSRAVRVGDRVWVSGTAPIMPGDADPSSIDEVGRAHAAAFATARPATTGIVTQLLDPRWLVEIEAEAVILHT